MLEAMLIGLGFWLALIGWVLASVVLVLASPLLIAVGALHMHWRVS